MAVEEQVCRARSGGCFLHDDYSHISHFEIEIAIDVEVIDGRRSEDCAGR